MTISFNVNGTRYEGFSAASVEIRLDALSNSFSFDISSDEGQPLPFRGGESIQVFADDEQVLDGFIETVNIGGDAGSHSIALTGRDKTGDLLDSMVSNLSDLTPPISLATICRLVIRHIGAEISVVDNVRPAVFVKAQDLASPEPGQNAFQFLEKMARKRQVLLTSNAAGDLVIERGSGIEGGGFLIHQAPDRGNNNVIRFSASYDQTGRFNLYQQAAQLNAGPLSFSGTFSTEQLVAQGGANSRAIDSSIRAGRQHVLVSESAFSDTQAADRAAWERNIRRARGRLYSATVSGFRDQAGDLWIPNRLTSVLDDFAGIDSAMLINTVAYSYTLGEGSTTTVGVVEKDAYTLDLAEPVADEEDGLGVGFG